MLEMELNLATVLVALVIVGLLVLAVKRVKKRGTCNCKDCTRDCSACNFADGVQ